jgi:hypothetical protein
MQTGDDDDAVPSAAAFFGSPSHGPLLAMLESFQEKCTQRYLDVVTATTMSYADEKQADKLNSIDAQIEQMNARLVELSQSTESMRQLLVLQHSSIDGVPSRNTSLSGGHTKSSIQSRRSGTADSTGLSDLVQHAAPDLGLFGELLSMYREDKCVPTFTRYPHLPRFVVRPS